jgi:Flp pilus assembly protein TadD
LNFKPQLLVAFLCVWPLAWADDYADVSKHIKSGNFTDALSQIDKALQTRPRDPQMRFFKGFVQRETGQLDAALATYTSITEDYPELPEPYNNLAVIYARQNQLEKARATLEMALRNNPQYTVAHENLGDIYVRLAQESFAKGLKLDAGNAALAAKIKGLKDFATP